MNSMATFTLLVVLGLLVAGQLAFFWFIRRRLVEDFQSISTRSLLDNNQRFVELARASMETFQAQANGQLDLRQQAIQELVAPLKGSLQKYESQVSEMERKREQAYGGLRQYLESVTATQCELRKETGDLAKALRSPNVRGKWGEMTLQRVLELSGMVEHCDFQSQESVPSGESRLRPDVIVDLPNGRRIVIDAKVPLDSYLKAVEAESDREKEKLMEAHCRQLRRHVTTLAAKTYWDELEGSPEFVVLFIPLESLFSAALRHDPELAENAVQKRVVLATPNTLIALLRAVEFGWKQQQLARNAEEVSTLGKELYDRLLTMSGHLTQLGTQLERAVQAYNKTAGSFESRVLVQARRFQDLGVSAKDDLPQAVWIESTPRRPDQDEHPESADAEDSVH